MSSSLAGDPAVDPRNLTPVEPSRQRWARTHDAPARIHSGRGVEGGRGRIYRTRVIRPCRSTPRIGPVRGSSRI